MKLIVFDLDFTLWDAGGTWCDQTNPPYQKVANNVLDSEGNCIRLYDDVNEVLYELKAKGYQMAIASRTFEPDWARQLLQLFNIEHYFKYQEIYPTDKTKHFHKLAIDSGIEFKNMVFFDDEYRNVSDVSSLGVNSIYVKTGITLDLVFSNLNN